MLDRPRKKSRRERLAFRRRADRMMDRLRQRWARGFRVEMMTRARVWRGKRHPGGFVGAFIDEIRRAT